MTGPDMTSKLKAAFTREVEAALIAIGITGANEMKSHLDTDGGIDTERLVNSMSFATNYVTKGARGMVTGKAKEEDLPKPPDVGPEDKAVAMGTNVPYAKYVNYGALPIGQGDGARTAGEPGFMDKIMAWAERQTWFDGSPEAVSRAHAIANSIAKNGTDAVPFFEPSIPVIRTAADKAIKVMADKLKTPAGDFWVIDPDGNARRSNTKGR